MVQHIIIVDINEQEKKKVFFSILKNDDDLIRITNVEAFVVRK